FENALLTRKRQPPQRGVHSGENRVFRLNATFDFHKKSKVICSNVQGAMPKCRSPGGQRDENSLIAMQQRDRRRGRESPAHP
ncbi:hypothetical protein, partial [Desulfovibrio sp. ZJ200]|uniref:hypothetical protein n=1 Tax=Desulfovibrio sp. ZJ200 TaxID=2709792 RepID=UPI0013EAFDAD